MSPLTEDEEVQHRRKTAAQKDENHLLRREQIITYNSVVLKEARELRSKLRHAASDGPSDAESDLESPKKKKRVLFELDKP